ncbi:S1 RNA-binding domain-containing protein [Kitasatospora sp. MBT63]|uniref:S1 RNA-binding domain-containing protein n=1 Tax=Kitasatospora sp. MBT63 TaxID=1444768 RepID=UPI00068EF0E0|nr:S1 RNA-binding domain-containing protein [Kitasatospora sp. MBT63]
MEWQSESPDLWAFLGSLRRGEILSGTVAAIERFGVFVALDDGPEHPMFPGVGFITIPELSWRHIDAATDVVEVGQRVPGEFLQFDTYNAEARLSLRALLPDPFQAFADHVTAGHALRGTVVRVLPFGAFVDIGDGVVGLVPFKEVHGRPATGTPEVFQVGAEVSVVVTDVERPQRRVFLAVPEEYRALRASRRPAARAEKYVLP